MKRMLIQTQLSNYDTRGRFILECDSGWQMVMGRVREMLKLVPDLHIDVMGPYMDLDGQNQLITSPYQLNKDLFDTGRVRYIEHWVIPNALATRYDFDLDNISYVLDLEAHKTDPSLRYDVVYINDPMHLRNFKALFMLKAGYRPKFVVHSHFIDNPECPKFPTEASLWLGQCEAAIKADVNFWQCESSMDVFFESMEKQFKMSVVCDVRAKSAPWDDGYSIAEIMSPVNPTNVRFDVAKLIDEIDGRTVIFVPNRIGGRGRSSDYTNCGKFMFDLLPQLAAARAGMGHAAGTDFVVIAGNPSQKFSNQELTDELGRYGYINLVPDALNRDEFKLVAKMSSIALGLYDQDSYGGTVARECVELGCHPLWLAKYEYLQLATGSYPFLCKPDFSDIVNQLNFMIDVFRYGDACGAAKWLSYIQTRVRARCSYEATTPRALELMGLLPCSGA